MIEDFSSGYYRTMLYVQRDPDGPKISQDLYDFINRRLYLDSPNPVRMRVGLDAGETFEVDAEGSVPQNVLGLPERFSDGDGRTSVFIVKPEYYYG